LMLTRFLRDRLKGYAKNRNHPDLDGTSQLSPYLHFGHVSPHTIALAVGRSGAPAMDRKAFLEELIVRRELAINFYASTGNTIRSMPARPGRIGLFASTQRIRAITCTRKNN